MICLLIGRMCVSFSPSPFLFGSFVADVSSLRFFTLPLVGSGLIGIETPGTRERRRYGLCRQSYLDAYT
jgi:hypothetical protein